MSKKSREKRRRQLEQQKKAAEDAFPNVYCPICRRDDQIEDMTDVPDMWDCNRCHIRFMYEELMEYEETTNAIADAAKRSGAAGRKVEQTSPKAKLVRTDLPVLGSMVELGASHDIH
jgi:hypothetical protein